MTLPQINKQKLNDFINFLPLQYLYTMSKQQTDTHLKFGQGIRIQGYKQPGDDIGFLTAKGFADSQAKYQTYGDILYFKNYRNAIFQILPAGNFQINDQYRKIMQNTNQQTPNAKILKARAKSEQQQFKLNIENKNKQLICFGYDVIFKHVDSDTYLSGTIRPSDGINGAFSVEVTKNLSQSLIFHLEPFRSFERVGLPIPFDSPIKIRNKMNNGYLTFQKFGSSGTKSSANIDFQKKPIVADQSYRIPVKTSSAQSSVYNTVTHFVDLSIQRNLSPMPWQFVLHVNQVQNDCLIQHDIVYFQHTANSGVLSTSGTNIILKELKEAENSSQLKFYQCLWEIQTYKQKNQNAYILRHLMSGMTLGVERVKQQGQQNLVAKRAVLVDISEGQSDGALQNGWVQLRLAKKQGGIINSDSFINICWGEACLDLKKQTLSNDLETQQATEQSLFPKAKMAQMAMAQQQYEIKQLQFTLDISKNCFIIQQINDDLKKKVLFALSFHSKIIDLRQDLKWGAKQVEVQEKVDYTVLGQVNQKVKQIKQFLKDCSYEDADKQYIHPLHKQQMICKDLGISELLFQLLFYMKQNMVNLQKPQIFQTKPNQQQKFKQLYNTIYDVITQLIRDNKLFKIHISKWIDFILQDVINNNEQSQLNLMKQLLKDNQFIVNNFVSQELVKYLTHCMMTKSKSHLFFQKKYIQIFRKFCIVRGNVNTQNQIKVLNEFIRELRSNSYENGFHYIIDLSVKDGVVSTFAAIDKNVAKKRKFSDYYKICKEQYQSAWHYFVQYLNLIADMTKGRNKAVQSVLQIMFTIDVLSQLFQQKELNQAEVPVIRLLHYLHAQSQKFYPIQRKKRIVDFQELETQQICVMSTNSKIKPWDHPIYKVMKVLLGKLQGHGPIDPKNMQQNMNLFHLLDFVWQTLNLGFWQTKDQIKDILRLVLKILQPHKDINYKQAKVESKQNILMIDCKNQCMNIIQLILDYDLDLTVRYLCKHFQKYKVPPKQKKNIQVQKLMESKVNNTLAKQFISTFPIQNQPIVPTTIISQMIELSNYNNPQLTSQSISIIQRTLLSKIKALQNFYKQVFVCGQQRKQLVKYIQQRKKKFYTLEDQTLTNVSLKNQEGNYVVVYKDDNLDSGIMQDIFMISQLIRQENKIAQLRTLPTLDSSKCYVELGTRKLVNFTSQRTSSDILKQNVLDAENVHWKVLQFIMNCRQIPKQELALKLLHLSYRFLVGLIWNYQNIKLQLINYVPSICHHISKNVGCIDFLKQMYDNNKNMLYNEVEISRLIREICIVMQNQPEDSFYKSKLLDFFRFLIYCNGKSLKFNQIQILKIMQDDSFKTIILKVDQNQIKHLVKQYLRRNQQQQEKFKYIVEMEPKLVYYCTYFQILQSLIDDNNTVNMGKLMKKFPFQFLVRLIKICQTCWPLKRNIRAFLNRLYYFQPQIQLYMKIIINEQVANIIQDLNYFILFKCKSNASDYEMQIFQNPVRFTYLESYLYLNLEENLFTLYELVTRKAIQEQMKNFLHSLNSNSMDGPYNFIRICERLGFIKNYFAEKKNVYSNSFIKFLLAKFRVIISEFDDNIYLEGMTGFGSMNRAPTKPQKEKARVYLIEKIMNGQISSFYVQDSYEVNQIVPLVYKIPDKILGSKDDKKPNHSKLIKKLRQILKRQKKQFKTQDEAILYKMSRIVTSIKLSPDAQVLLMKDYNSKLQPYSSQQIIFKYITIIIQMNSSNPQALPQDQKKFFLQLITGIVQQNNKTQMTQIKTLDQWDGEDWLEYRDKIQHIQLKLKSCGLGKFISELLKQNIYDNIQFANAILLCGIAYMLGGNTLTQKNIIEELDADDMNKVMNNIDILISKLGKFILKNVDDSNVQQDPQNAFSTTTIDNYDFYDVHRKYVLRKNVFEPVTTDQQIYHQKCMVTYRRAFKFLQLLCQNNNIQGKNFIREQPRKVRQANFINVATKQLRNLFLVMTKGIAEVPMFLLDFLLQVTQIPIKANQQALMSLTFFEDLCQMESFFVKGNNIEKRGFENETGLLDQIYFKSIQIILSNFEGNQKKTFEAVDAKLQPPFLINILRRKLQQMQVKSKKDLQVYIQKKCDKVFDQNMMSILNIIKIYIKLKQQLGQQNSRVYPSYSKEKSQNAELYEYLESLLINIQINDQYNKLQKVLFPKYPVFSSLSGNLRDYVMSVVERGSHRDKIVSLLGYTNGIKDKIQKSYTLEKTEHITEKNMNNSFILSAIMSIVLCIYMMQFYDVIIQYGEAQFTSGRLIGLGRFFLSLIQLSMSCVYAYYWYKLKIWEKPQRKSREATAQAPVWNQDQQQGLQEDKTKKSKFSFILDKINQLKKDYGFGQQDTGATKIYNSVDFYRLLLYLSVSFFGTFFHPPLFFIHIIDIFCNNPDLGNIFAAIAISIKSILYVSALGIVFVFIFCTVTFSNYMKDVYAEGQSESQMCQTMFECLMQLFVSGVIGESMSTFEIMRFTYDMIYITFFGLLFGNIVSGIMLDAFGSLRTQNDELIADKKNKCYICNISREELQKQGISFVDHTQKRHFLWNYVFYIYLLETKDSTEYTGLQYYISTRYNRPDEQVDVDWVPSGDQVEFDSAEKLKQLIQKVDDQNKKIDQNLAEIQNRINQFNQIAGEYMN